MKKRYISVLAVTSLLVPSLAFAASDAVVTGNVEMGFRAVDDQDKSAKFQEYRALDDGTYGEIVVDAYKGAYFLEMDGKNVGQDDQSYLLKGGEYSKFKYSFSYDKTPHNLSFDAKTFYSGVGGNDLDFSGATPAPEANWSIFDYAITRENYGGDVEISMNTPFYFGFGMKRLETEGVKPLGSGGFGGQTELPEPVDYITDDVNVRAGYRSKTFSVAVTGMLSSFENDYTFLGWKDRVTAAADINTLAPDNDYNKIATNIAWKKLPFASTLAINASYAKLESDFNVSDLNITAPAGLNTTSFEGDIDYTNVSVVFSSRLTKDLDSRIYFNYLDKNNDSTVIAYTGGGNATHIFDYSKDNAGLDLGYRLPMQTKVRFGYEYLDVDRTNRPDAESTTDHIGYIQIKNTALDFLTAQVQYKHTARDSDFSIADPTLVNTDAGYIQGFVERYDATDKNKDEIKLSLELYPMENLDLGFEYTYEVNDYDDVTLGRTDDESHQFYVDAMVRLPRKASVSAFAGYEMNEANADRYAYTAGSGAPPQTADPTIDDGNPDSYLWSQDLTDDFWTYGVSAQVPLLDDKLRIVMSWEYQDSDGQSDFSSQGATALEDIDLSDDYKMTTLEAKAVYAFAEKLDFTLGYIYEKYKYEDLQYDGYEYVPSGSYLTGAYADHDYEANIGYLLVKYGF
jgi:MtrB/PioB family decaheme-associated outer membrane protein